MKNSLIKISLVLVIVFISFVFYANAGSEPLGGSKSCEVHGPTMNCGTSFTPFPLANNYYQANVNYSVYGHRHGASQIDVRICIIPSGSPSACQEWGCSGSGCGAELGGGEGNANILLHSDSFGQGASPDTSFQISTWAFIDDAGVVMDWNATAIYADAPPPPPLPQDYTVACIVRDAITDVVLGSALCSYSTGQSCTTNSTDGYCALQILSGTRSLTVSRANYNSFSGTYNIIGNKNIDVYLQPISGGGVSVNCSPSSQSVITGSSVNFSAGGGSGTFSWSAPGGSPSSGTNSSFTTSYTTTGTKTVTVTRGASSDTCSVSVSTTGGGGSCADGATIVSTDLPASLTLTPGQTHNFTVTMQNSGTTYWFNGGTGGNGNELTGYKYLQSSATPLTIIETIGCSTGLNYGHLCSSVNVPSQITWAFTLTAPTTPGTYPFSMNMNHAPTLGYRNTSNITCSGAPLDAFRNYFGQTLSSNIVVSNPNPKPTADMGCNPNPAGPSIEPCSTLYNNNVYLFWSSTDATSCDVYNDTAGTTVLSGGPTQSLPGAPVLNMGNLTQNPTTFRITCSGPGGTSPSDWVTVNVDQTPIVTTSVASGVTPTSAILAGTVNPNGQLATGWFRYSTTDPVTCNDTFGTKIVNPPTPGNMGSGTTASPFSQNTDGQGDVLLSNTTYYYCAIASNASGTGFGNMRSFTTSVAPTLTVQLTASPGTFTLGTPTDLGAVVSGTATGTINYNFWWDCAYTDATPTTAEAQVSCGDPDITPTCTNQALGNKCDAVVPISRTVTYTYPTTGTKRPIVIVERGSLSAMGVVTGNVVVNPVLTCSPSSQSVNINVNATMTAAGGTGTYSWTGGGTPATGSGASFATQWSTTGLRTVTVTSGTQTATCNVDVTSAPTLNVSLIASPGTIDIGQPVDLGTVVDGTVTGTINYNIWWDCSYNTGGSDPTPTVAEAQVACGDPDLVNNCSNQSLGYKCDGQLPSSGQGSRTISYTYLTSGSKRPIVIVERGGLSAFGLASAGVTVNSTTPVVSAVTLTEPNYCQAGPGGTINWMFTP